MFEDIIIEKGNKEAPLNSQHLIRITCPNCLSESDLIQTGKNAGLPVNGKIHEHTLFMFCKKCAVKFRVELKSVTE